MTKKTAFLLALFLCGDVMVFPWALRHGWLIWWILSIIVFVALSMLWSNIDIKNKCLGSRLNAPPENQSSDEIPSLPQESCLEAIEASETVEILETFDTDIDLNLDSLSIEELIDLGFREKNSDNFAQAAAYFSRALSLDPMPDLAFYLIIDSYWLWNTLGEHDYAITQLHGYIQKYLPKFNTRLRNQFDIWMTKEDLLNMIE